MLAPIVEAALRDPWNKGKLVGQKVPLKLGDIWAIASANSRCSIWRSTASCAAAISCNCAFAMSLTPTGSPRARSSCNKKTQRPVQFEITELTRKSVFAFVGTQFRNRCAAIRTGAFARCQDYRATRSRVRRVE